MKWILRVLGVILLIAIGAQFVGFGIAYTVDETEYVVITQFGQVQRPVTTPGLKFKSPIETVVKFDNRLLRIDVPVASMPDRESQFLEIDAYIRYRIKDPQTFLETLRDETTAGSRIGNLAIAAIRAEVGVRDREDIIGGEPDKQSDGTILVQPRKADNGVYSREAMMKLVLAGIADIAESDFGIEIEDVRIKRADFPAAAENSVFDRMRSERSVQAQRLRAQGEEEYLTLTATVNKEVVVIVAEAERDANVLLGEGEGEAVRILAEALEKDEEFFAFRRSLEAYGNSLSSDTTVVLSADSSFFQYLEDPLPGSSN